MAKVTFNEQLTALLVIDTSISFSEGGKIWHRIQAVAEGNDCVPHMLQVVRYAAELGYEVTMVEDATADYSDDAMHAALDINIPTTPVL